MFLKYLWCFVLFVLLGCDSQTINDKLIAAVYDNNYELVKQYIKEGANVNYKKDIFINDQGKDTWPEVPLAIAVVKNDNIDIARLLYENNADPNIISSSNCNLLFYMTDYSLYKKWIEINHLNVNQICNDGHMTPIYVFTSYPDIIKLLLDNGADPNIQSTTLTPLIKTIVTQRFSSFNILLNSNVDIEQTDGRMRTALHVAAQQEDPYFLNMLIKKGCQLDRQDKNGQTALHLAFMAKKFNNVDILLKAGANPKIKNKEKYLYNEYN